VVTPRRAFGAIDEAIVGHVEERIDVIAVAAERVAERERLRAPRRMRFGKALAAVAPYFRPLCEPVRVDAAVELDGTA
jgi:hypothetical protein